MTMTYTRFDPPRRLAAYQGQTGSEAGGRLLSPDAYQALADAKMKGREPMLVVRGEYVGEGRRYLHYAVTKDYIEANTNWRDDGFHLLHWTCPTCGMKSGKHTKSCDFE